MTGILSCTLTYLAYWPFFGVIGSTPSSRLASRTNDWKMKSNISLDFDQSRKTEKWKPKLYPRYKPKRCRVIEHIEKLFLEDDDYYDDDDWWGPCREWEIKYGAYMPTQAPSTIKLSGNPTAMTTTLKPTDNPLEISTTTPTLSNSIISSTYSPSITPSTNFPSIDSENILSNQPSSSRTFMPTIDRSILTSYPSVSSTVTGTNTSEPMTARPTEMPSILQSTLNPTPIPSEETKVPSSFPTLNMTSEPSVTPTPIPGEETKVPSSFPTLNMTSEPSVTPTPIPSEEIMMPSPFPTLIVVSEPSVTPSPIPIEETANPSSFPNSNPTSEPSVTPSMKPSSFSLYTPTNVPTRKTIAPTFDHHEKPSMMQTEYPSKMILHPSNFPTIQPSKVTVFSTGYPSSIDTVAGKSILELSSFSLRLTFATARRLWKDRRNNKNDLRGLLINNLDEDQLYNLLKLFLDTHYDNIFSPTYESFDLTTEQAEVIRENDSTTITYTFYGQLVFSTDNSNLLPNKGEIDQSTLDAFLGATFINTLRAAEDPILATVNTLTVTKILNTNKEGNFALNRDIEIEGSGDKSSLTITIVAGSIASVCSAAALIILSTRGRTFFRKNQNRPSKKSVSSKWIYPSIFYASSFKRRAGMGKFFQEMNDEDSHSNEYSSANEEKVDKIVMVKNYSFSEESSIDAPSFLGISSFHDKSDFIDDESIVKYGSGDFDGKSISSMSALEEVRLDSVLQIEEGFAEDGSFSDKSGKSLSQLLRKDSFYQVWNNHRRKGKKAASVQQDSRDCFDWDQSLETQKQDNDLPTESFSSPSHFEHYTIT